MQSMNLDWILQMRTTQDFEATGRNMNMDLIFDVLWKY